MAPIVFTGSRLRASRSAGMTSSCKQPAPAQPARAHGTVRAGGAGRPKPDGTIYLKSGRTLPPYPEKLTDRLVHWAARAPDRVFMAERDGAGWRTITYAQTLASVRRIGAALLHARSVARAADRHPLRQRSRARAARARGELRRHSVCAGLARLFADLVAISASCAQSSTC